MNFKFRIIHNIKTKRINYVFLFKCGNYTMSNFFKLGELLQKQLAEQGTHIYFLRHGQSLANHAGSIVGWTDSKLSVKGREQANKLFRSFHKHIDSFTHIHSSDLSRARDTLDLALGFPLRPIIVHANLRELNFGDDEGVHFDSLPPAQKAKVNTLSYQAPNGQNWEQARVRAMSYIKTLEKGHHLISTHGGLMCALLHNLGVKHVVPNCSVAAVQLCPEKKQLHKLSFLWEFKEEETAL